MSWSNLTEEILKTECIGSSLSTINGNFENLDLAIRDLSADYMPIDSVLGEIAAQGSLAQGSARSNLGLGTIATLPNSVAAKAWVNINGNSSAAFAVSGTYTKSGTTITATITGHGLRVGDYVYLNFTSGTATDKTVVVATVPNANTFTATDQNAWTLPTATSSTTSGNVNYVEFPRLGSYNIRKVIWVPDYNSRVNYAVYFDTNMSNTFYAAIATASIGGSGSEEDNQAAGVSRQFTNFFLVGIWSGSTTEYSKYVNCVVFG